MRPHPTKVLVSLPFLIPEQLWQTLLKPLQYLDIRKVLLREPGRSHDAQLRLDRAEALRAVADHHDCLLYRTPSYVGGAVDQFACVELSRARYAEERGCGVSGRGCATEGEVRVVFY
jgi:hypothetical protein